jgi:hypothetical protein
MASQLKVDTLTGVTTAGSIDVTGEGNSTTTNLQQGLAKAWADIDMTGTASNDKSFNIASFTDAGVGAFNLVISSDMADANYCFSVGFNNQASDASGFLKITGSQRATGQINMQKRENGNVVDCDVNCTTIHGDLA